MVSRADAAAEGERRQKFYAAFLRRFGYDVWVKPRVKFKKGGGDIFGLFDMVGVPTKKFQWWKAAIFVQVSSGWHKVKKANIVAWTKERIYNEPFAIYVTAKEGQEEHIGFTAEVLMLDGTWELCPELSASMVVTEWQQLAAQYVEGTHG